MGMQRFYTEAALGIIEELIFKIPFILHRFTL